MGKDIEIKYKNQELDLTQTDAPVRFAIGLQVLLVDFYISNRFDSKNWGIELIEDYAFSQFFDFYSVEFNLDELLQNNESVESFLSALNEIKSGAYNHLTNRDLNSLQVEQMKLNWSLNPALFKDYEELEKTINDEDLFTFPKNNVRLDFGRIYEAPINKSINSNHREMRMNRIFKKTRITLIRVFDI